jgi:hypothetical protein
MDRRILIALAAVAGICAAILLFPSRDKVDADVAVGHDHAPSDDAATAQETPRKGKKRRVNDVSDDVAAPVSKEASKAANEARRATPYYQHVQAAAKRWLVMANTIGPAGQDALATEMRELSRELRAASRPDGTEDAQKAALAHEGELITKAQAVSLDAEMTEILDYLVQAHQAATTGVLPPEAGESHVAYEPTAGDEQAEPGSP